MPDAYEFGPFHLDPGEHRLLRDTLPVSLTPKTFDLLVDLVQHAGRLREKRQLMEGLWPDAFVEEGNLTHTVAALRRVLADDPAHPRFIETVATKGYRFIAPVRSLEEPPGGDSTRDKATGFDPAEHSPYPGLRSFTEQDAGVFFGREDEVTALWLRIRARPLLAVIGPSGSGKTSFLRAGVLARRPAGWAAIVWTPGTAPLRALGQALAPEVTTDLDALRQLVAFDDPEVAITVLSRWRRAHTRALVVVDQFEELFTNNPPDVQARVATLIGRLAAEADIHVVLSVRDDFLMRCHEHAALASVFSEVTPLGALTPASLRRALVEPALARGYRFEDEALVDEMIDCVAAVRAPLPLLAFAVARLWQLRDPEQRLLTRAACEQIGGVSGALAQHAEATLDRIGALHHDLVRDLFRNLVTAQGTRAVMDRDELLSAFPRRPEAAAVLRELVDARLLTSYEVKAHAEEPDHHRIEIVHESLLTAWPRLVRWQTQDEHAAQLRDQLKQAAHLWAEKGQTTDLLWTGTAFREYALWREHYPGALTAVEEDFARAMTACAQRRRRLQRAAVTAIIVALSVVALAIGVSRQQATRARDAATAAARRAEASKLLAFAELRLAEDPTEAALLAGASLEQADTPEARTFLMKALWSGPLAFELVADQGVAVPMFSPDGRQLAAAGHSPVARVWTEDGRGPVLLPGHGLGANGPNVPKWASNDLLVIGGWGTNFVHVWSLPRGEHVRTIEFGRPWGYWEVGPSRLLLQTPEGGGASSPEPLLLRSWRLPDGDSVTLGRVDLRALRATSWLLAPDGRALLYVKDRAVYARELPVGTAPDRVLLRLGAPLRDYGADANHVFFEDEAGEYRMWKYGDADGPQSRVAHGSGRPGLPDWSGRWWSAVAHGDQAVRLWDINSWAEARPLELRRRASWYVPYHSVHPSGDWVVVSTARFTRLTFWPVQRTYARVVEGYTSIWRPVAFSPDGKWLATSWGDMILRLWPLPGSGTNSVRTLSLPERELSSVFAFDPTGRYLFTAGGHGRTWLIPLDGSPPRRLVGFPEEAAVFAGAVSPSGQRVAAAFGFGQGERTLRVWDLQSGSSTVFDLPRGRAFEAYQGTIYGLAFGDEATLYTTGDGGVRRWNLRTGTQELVVASPPGFAAIGKFSSNAGVALLTEVRPGRDQEEGRPVRIFDTRAGSLIDLPHALDEPGQGYTAIDPSGTVAALGSDSGLVRVWRVGEKQAHILAGHKGAVGGVAISPDLRWVASTGEDNTLRLWPMPDLSKPPLHTLPLDQLLAKLHSLTNLRAVRDPSSSTGWKIEVRPFPGWKHVPTW